MQLLILEKQFNIECKYDLISNESFPYLDESNNIDGTQLVLQDTQG
jgi:hypothetical protein